jgi:hypothetical protein
MKEIMSNPTCRIVSVPYKEGAFTVLKDGRFVYMDHLIMNAQEGEEVIHRDGDPYNCMRENLILVPSPENN